MGTVRFWRNETPKDTVARQPMPLRMNHDLSIRNTLGGW